MERRPIGLRLAGWYLLTIGLFMAVTSGMTDGQPVNVAVLVA